MKVIGLILLAASALFAESSIIDSGSASNQKFGFYWETRLDPGTPELSSGFGRKTHWESTADRLVIYRIFVDRRAETYFGYVAAVGMREGSQPTSYMVSVAPLVLTLDVVRNFDLKIDNLASWRQLPFKGLQPQSLRSGDVVGFALVTNPTTGQRITESITISEPSVGRPSFDSWQRREFSYPPGEARELAVADVEFALNSPRVFANGTSDEGANGIRAATGRTLLVKVPKLGRFTLSMVPRPGFAAAGEIRGTIIRFKSGADSIEIQSATRIAPADGPFILYVRRDGADDGRWSLTTSGVPDCRNSVIC